MDSGPNVSSEGNNEVATYMSTSKRRKVIKTNHNVELLTNIDGERTVEDGELSIKCSGLELEQPLVRQQQQQKKKIVANTRQSVNFSELIGYDRLKNMGTHSPKMIISRLYNYQKLADISGGFRFYLRCLTDNVLNEICDKIDDQGNRFDTSSDMDLYVAQVLRYAWCRLTENERLKYEIAARTEIRKICRTKMEILGKSEKFSGSAGSISQAKQWIRAMPAMPLTEFPFMSTWVKEQKEDEKRRLKDKQSRCPLCKDVFLKDDALQIHILYDHHNIYVYACHCCFKGFTSFEKLKKHSCQGFADFMFQQLSREGKEIQWGMKFAMHTLVCAECNLQVPLSSVSDLSGDKRRIKLQRLLKYHNMDKLVSCITLFAAKPTCVEYVTVKCCAMKHGIPLQCPFCSHMFTCATDIEKHQTSEHSSQITKLKCPVCPRFYVTDLFYRDHLLLHLGEMYSLTDFLEQGTFWPPAFSSETTLKMGPLLQKIVGSDVTRSSMVEMPNDVTDDEDATFEKSLMKKKVETVSKVKKQKRKISKKTERSPCYYCKQVKQVTSSHGPLPCSHGSKKLANDAKSAAVKNSLIHTLVEKFTREGRLYVDRFDSVYDTTIGAIIDDSVFICVKCKALHLGEENTLKHLRICMQKEVESPDPEKYFDLMDSSIVVRLSQRRCSPNGRISCPECEETSCSIASLRRHLALQHGIFAYYNAPEIHKTVGIMEYAPSNAVADTKIGVAAKVNAELNLTPWGDFRLKHERKTQLSSGLIASVSSAEEDISNTDVSPQMCTMSQTVRSASTESIPELAKNSTSRDKFVCVICFISCCSSQLLANHFVRYHLHWCSECGSGFVDKERLLSHLVSCQKCPRKCVDGEFFPCCPVCSFLLLTPERYYYHLLHCHETRLIITPKDKQITPMFIWKKLTPTDAARLRKVSSIETESTSPVENITRSDTSQASGPTMKGMTNVEPAMANKFSCVLCELDFPDQTELDSHLQQHPEKWSSCPVCLYFKDHCPVDTVQELFAHLLNKHATKSLQPKGLKIICSLCRTISSCESTTSLSIKRCEEQMVRHILYSCNGTQACFLCSVGGVYTPEKLRKHRITEHQQIFERFGCSRCSRKFHTHSAFRKHSCSMSFKCSCGTNAVFKDLEFEKHFNKHLNSRSDFCLLCNKYLFSKDQLVSHLSSHRIVVNGKRQLIQLNPSENTEAVSAPNTVLTTNAEQSDQPFIANKASSTTFQFLNAKVDNDDDDILFLGIGKRAADQKKVAEGNTVAEGNDVVCIAETIPSNFITRVRLEAETTELPTRICAHPVEATPTVQIPVETDEAAVINDIVDNLIDAVNLPTCVCFEGGTISSRRNTCSASTNVPQHVTAAQCSLLQEQNVEETAKKDIYLPETVEKQLTSEATDENDDDDLVVVDEQENKTAEAVSENTARKETKRAHTSGDTDVEIIETVVYSESQRTKKRQANYPCNQCTEKFLTKGSLLAHKETHRFDAGQTIAEVYGIPIETTLFICRLCCLAYESKETYQKHMHTHGLLYNCERCSVVAFNDEQMKTHREQHISTSEKQQLVYVCTKCMCTYSTEERLYHHMFNAHSQAILYFCKSCGLGNTNGRAVFEHIGQNECNWKKQSQTECPIMGFTAACMFHYQPVDQVEYENKVRSGAIFVVVPSECIHRSFLSQQNEVIIVTCPTCNALMSFLRLKTENLKFAESMPRVLKHAADDDESMMMAALNVWKKDDVNRPHNTPDTGSQQSPILVRISDAGFSLPQVSLPSATFVAAALPATPTVVANNNIPLRPLSSSNIPVCFPSNQGSINVNLTQPSIYVSSAPTRQALTTAVTTAAVTLCSQLASSSLPSSSSLQAIQAGGVNLNIRHPSAQLSLMSARQSPIGPPSLAPLPFHATVGRPTLSRLMNNATFAVSAQSAASNASMVRMVSPAVRSPLSSKSQLLIAGSEPTLSASKIHAYLQPYRGALEAVSLVPVGTQMVTRDYIVKNAEGQFLCARSECVNVRIAKMTSGRVHNLRHNPQNIFFCLECGSAFPFENLIVKHMIEVHHQMKRPEFCLRCPLCPGIPPFKEVEAFRKHMAGQFSQHPFAYHSYSYKQRQAVDSLCKLQFHSVEARMRHDLEHRATKNAPCCCVCGTSQNWWFRKESGNEVPYIDHTYIHAFSLWGMCRECGLCHPNELKNQQYHRHFQEMHMIRRSTDVWYCKICERNVDTWNIEVHALQRHFVIGVKTDRRKPYTVEISESMMRAFLGYPVADDARI